MTCGARLVLFSIPGTRCVLWDDLERDTTLHLGGNAWCGLAAASPPQFPLHNQVSVLTFWLLWLIQEAIFTQAIFTLTYLSGVMEITNTVIKGGLHFRGFLKFYSSDIKVAWRREGGGRDHLSGSEQALAVTAILLSPLECGSCNTIPMVRHFPTLSGREYGERSLGWKRKT